MRLKWELRFDGRLNVNSLLGFVVLEVLKIVCDKVVEFNLDPIDVEPRQMVL